MNENDNPLRFESVWDAICDTPEEAARMKALAAAKLEERKGKPFDWDVEQGINGA